MKRNITFQAATAVITCLLMVALSSVASAFADRTYGNCSGCHGGTGPTLMTDPGLLEIEAGTSGMVDFVTGTFPEGVGRIKLTGIDATGLEPDDPAAQGWTVSDDGDFWLSPIASEGPFTFAFGIGATAVWGDYPLGVQVVGGDDDRWNTIGQDFTVSVIPEPATLVLLLTGFVCVGIWRRNRVA